MKPKALLLAAISCALLWTISAAAAPPQKEKVLKGGEKGQITLTEPTNVDNTVLQPGTYVVQHRVSGNDHFIRFMEMKKLQELNVTPETAGWYTYTEENTVGEIKCRVEPAGTTVQETSVTTIAEDGGPRITKVMIKGEDDLHIF